MCTTSSELGKVLRQQEVGLQSGEVLIFRDFLVVFGTFCSNFLHAGRGSNPRTDFPEVISRPPDIGPFGFFLKQ